MNAVLSGTLATMVQYNIYMHYKQIIFILLNVTDQLRLTDLNFKHDSYFTC